MFVVGNFCDLYKFQPRLPYSFRGDASKVVQRNLIRVAEVWWDDYKQYYYATQSSLTPIDVISLRQRKKIRENLKCHSFQWYMDNLLPEVVVPIGLPEYFGLLHIKSDTSLCGRLDEDRKLTIDECENMDGHFNVFGIDSKGYFKHNNNLCISPANGNYELSLIPCKEGDQWIFKENDQIVNKAGDKCLQKESKQIILSNCDENKKAQKWQFTHHFYPTNGNWSAEKAFFEATRRPKEAIKFGAVMNPSTKLCINIVEGIQELLPCVLQPRYEQVYYLDIDGRLRHEGFCFEAGAMDGIVFLQTGCDGVTVWNYRHSKIMAHDMCLAVAGEILALAECVDKSETQTWLFMPFSK